MTVTPSPQSVVSDRALEQIAFNLCSLHDFPVDFVKANERFARSVITEYLRAAPAPSSLAGGEVTNDDAPTYMRLAQALSRHPEVMVVERSDPTLELTPDSLEHLLDDVFPLAALSPEAPAREGVDAIMNQLADIITEASVDYPAGRDAGHSIDYDEDAIRAVIEAALTPRHEAPAEGAGESLPERLRFAETWDLDADQSARDRCGVLMLEAAEALERAALSPEAPARDVEAYDKFKAPAGSTVWIKATVTDNCTSCCSVVIDAIHGKMHLTVVPRDVALTPRHEAPASAVDDLVDRFAAALKEKLHAAEAKYGHDDAWMRDDWRDDLIEQLWRHVQKGDPRDVAAYCAFAWHHGWSLSLGEPVGPIVFTDGRRHEAPAGVVGEALKPYLSLINSTPDLLSLLYDADMLPEQTVTMRGAVSVAAVCEAYQAGLRARSSAPEAREGEAVAWMRLTAGQVTDLTCIEQSGYRPLYLSPPTHPAAPSADKLRAGLDEIERLVNQSGAIPKGELRSILAALKAEDA